MQQAARSLRSQAPRGLGHLLVLSAWALLQASAVRAAPPPALEPPPEARIAEARSLVLGMRSGERGPYLRLRWYCNDGTVHPPQPYPCEQRGGGRQHAQYSPDRERLAALGFHVGTILAATPWEELWDPENRNVRLRELALERYLVDIDDGWVMHRARYYRGALQIEDEEKAGQALLRELLERPDWVRDNFLVVHETLRTLPHSRSGDRTRKVRRLAQDLGAAAPSFEPIRTKIHTWPDAGDARRVRDWIEASRGPKTPPEAIATARELKKEIEALYARDTTREQYQRGLARRPRRPWGAELDGILQDIDEAPRLERLRRLAGLVRLARDAASAAAPAGEAGDKVELLDLALTATGELRTAAFALVDDPRTTRGDLLAAALSLTEAGYGEGLLSASERTWLAAALEKARAGGAPSLNTYHAAARALERAGGWVVQTARSSFAEPLVAYTALDPRAQTFVDDLVRESAALPLARIGELLLADADSLAGETHLVMGSAAVGLRGLNPGAASGTLRVAGEADLARTAGFAKHEIVVLPRLVSELPPVAGILAVSEGNLLSHIQLLARNLGIPNATISPAVAERLRGHAGTRVVMAVSSAGLLVVEHPDRLPPALLERLDPATPVVGTAGPVDPPVPDLSVRRLLRLAELHAGLSGKVVGPKAANLGELNRNFPGRVAPAVAIPFGVFAAEAGKGPGSPKARLDDALRRFRAGRLDEAGLDAEVESVRAAIEALALSPGLREELGRLMRETFGPPGSYGIFVRSDTSVEDLPGFSGAGLNLTLPNVVDPRAQVAGIAKVWASPFRPRPMAWRRRALTRAEDVYPSVLLMRSVPADKSGVLVTRDLVNDREGITVATSWGVAGAVEGEVAETLVLADDGSVELVSEAKSPYQRRMSSKGGLEWRPAPLGPVLDAAERRALRALAADLRACLTAAPGPGGPLPWDAEFGFVAGDLQLFQVRPLSEKGQDLANDIVAALAPRSTPARGRVDLARPPRGAGGPASRAPAPGPTREE